MLALLAIWTASVRVFVVVELVQFNVDGASVSDMVFLKVTTTTNVFADAVTVRFVVSRRAVLLLAKVEAVVNSLSTRAIAARAGAASNRNATSTPNSVAVVILSPLSISGDACLQAARQRKSLRKNNLSPRYDPCRRWQSLDPTTIHWGQARDSLDLRLWCAS